MFGQRESEIETRRVLRVARVRGSPNGLVSPWQRFARKRAHHATNRGNLDVCIDRVGVTYFYQGCRANLL